MGKVKKEFINKKSILDLFSKDLNEAIQRYENFIMDGMSIVTKEFEKGPYIGDKESLKNVKKKLHSVPIIQISLDTITDFVCKSMGIEKGKLFLTSRNRALARVRGIVGYLSLTPL